MMGCRVPGCGRPLPPGSHGNVRYCDEHKPVKNRVRDLRRGAEAGDEQAKTMLGAAGYATPIAPTGSSSFTKLQLLAIALGTVGEGGSVAEAAELAGIKEEPEILEAMAAIARIRFSGLIERKLSSIGGLTTEAQMAILVRLREVIPTLPATQAASAARQISDIQERLWGGSQPQYADISVTLKLPDGCPTIVEW